MDGKSLTLLGIVFIFLGIAAFSYKGITYTRREKIVDVSPITATADAENILPISPLSSGFVLLGGIALVVIGRKKSF